MALGQLSFDGNGEIKDKVQKAIDRPRAFEPEDGYYLAFSGGKDSQCIYHLAKMAGVRFDAHYSVTSVDPPELVQFIKKNYPDAWENRVHQYKKDGTPYTMWNLIPETGMPPTRLARYCCKVLKEPGGIGRVVVTGVRWAESSGRKKNSALVQIRGKHKKTRMLADKMGVEYGENKNGSVMLNDTNDESRNLVEHCFRQQKTVVNPIIDWEDEDVWSFLDSNNIEHCCLYDKGSGRLGCIGCPMNRHRSNEFDRYPKYKQYYIRAFDKMLVDCAERGYDYSKWPDGNAVFEWWISRD